MTPEDLSALHASAMTVPAPWSARDFTELLAAPGVFLVCDACGFALGRVTVDEAELLTLAVAPKHQRGGIGTALLGAFEKEAKTRAATRAYLEVAATNGAAKALYAKAGWVTDGLRKGYYRAKPTAIDAIMMSKALNSL